MAKSGGVPGGIEGPGGRGPAHMSNILLTR